MDEAKTFEEAYRELEATVKRLEEGDLTLEEAMALFEKGMELVQYCQRLLDEAELRVKALLPTEEGYQEVDYSEEA
jgi:exodeoxyribonuclease VII small subunit